MTNKPQTARVRSAVRTHATVTKTSMFSMTARMAMAATANTVQAAMTVVSGARVRAA